MTVVSDLAAADQPAPIVMDVPLQKTNLLGLALADLEAEMVTLGIEIVSRGNGNKNLPYIKYQKPNICCT